MSQILKKRKKENASWVINPAGIKLFCDRYCESFA